jgi:Flp pilus assembly protein TadG
MTRLTQTLRRFGSDRRGVAAVEMALIGTLLATALMNVAEVSKYAYESAQLAVASQAGAQAILGACDVASTPVTENCLAATSAATTAIRGTSLGDRISLHGDLTEAWYCTTANDTLTRMGGPNDPPGSCPGSAAKPALYVRVQVEFDYEPMFPGLTLAETFPDQIVKTAWMRVK